MRTETATEQYDVCEFLSRLADIESLLPLDEDGSIRPREGAQYATIAAVIKEARAYFELLEEVDVAQANAAYRATLCSDDPKVRRGGLVLFNALFALDMRPREANAPAYPKTVTFAVFGEAMLPPLDGLDAFDDTEELQFWVARQMMIPVESVLVSGGALPPDACKQDFTELRHAVSMAQQWDTLDAQQLGAPVTPACGEVAPYPLVFMVTITCKDARQLTRVSRFVDNRAGLAQPNLHVVELGYAGERRKFQPHDISWVLTSLTHHLYFKAQVELRRVVQEALDAGFQLDELGLRFRTFAGMYSRPQTVMFELYLPQTREVLTLFCGPATDEECYFIPRMTELCKTIGIPKIKVQKRRVPEVRATTHPFSRLSGQAAPVAENGDTK